MKLRLLSFCSIFCFFWANGMLGSISTGSQKRATESRNKTGTSKPASTSSIISFSQPFGRSVSRPQPSESERKALADLDVARREQTRLLGLLGQKDTEIRTIRTEKGRIEQRLITQRDALAAANEEKEAALQRARTAEHRVQETESSKLTLEERLSSGRTGSSGSRATSTPPSSRRRRAAQS